MTRPLLLATVLAGLGLATFAQAQDTTAPAADSAAPETAAPETAAPEAAAPIAPFCA